MIKKTVIFISVILLLFAANAYSACTGSSPAWECTYDTSAADIQTCIGDTSDGDTILITGTGSATWTATVTIANTKGITIRVENAYFNSKVDYNFPVTITSNQDPAIQITCADGNEIARVSGFHFTNTSGTGEFITIEGGGNGTGNGAYRIDNNFFEDIEGDSNAGLDATIWVNCTVISSGALTGLVDNNYFHDCGYTDDYLISVTELYQYGGSGSSYCGGHSWYRTMTWGGQDFHLFFEDNVIESVSQYCRHYIATHAGGRWVARYNSFDSDNDGGSMDMLEGHGACGSSTGQSVRAVEIYQNTFDGDHVGRPINLRGGSGLVYDNTFLTTDPSYYIWLNEYRSWGACSASFPAIDPWYAGPEDDDPSRYVLEQQIGDAEDSYFWNNDYNSVDQDPHLYAAGYVSHYIQEDRDYYTCTDLADAKSEGLDAGYTGYTYPHPLRGSGQGNTDLTVGGGNTDWTIGNGNLTITF